MNDGEYGNTKNSFFIKGGISDDNKTLYEKIVNSYAKTQGANFSKRENIHSIDDELSLSLAQDKDFNSNISLKEAYSKQNSNLNYEKVIFKHAITEIPHAVKEAMSEDLTLKLLEEQTKESQKQLEALQKLKIVNGDISTLSQNELKALDGLLPSDTKNISNEEIDNISKNITDQMKIIKTYRAKDSENASKIVDLEG